MSNKTYRGQGKNLDWTLKTLKKLCIKEYGLGYILATPKNKRILIGNMNAELNRIMEEL